MFEQYVFSLNPSLSFLPQGCQQFVDTCKFGLKISNVLFYIKKKTQIGHENHEKIVVIKDTKKEPKFSLIVACKIHKLVGPVRRRLLLQVSEAQSTGLRLGRPPPETAASWRCGPLINNLTAHLNSQFCVSFHFCFDCKALSRL